MAHDTPMFSVPDGFNVDWELLQEFERGLNRLAPERSRIPCRVLGYGEISTVLEIQAKEMRGLAFKRMSVFETQEELNTYLTAYLEYNRLLGEEIGLRLPPHGHAVLLSTTGRPMFYIIQAQVPAAAIGSRALGWLSREATLVLFERILYELRKVWDFNGRRSDRQLAIDGQISNWAIAGLDPKQPVFSEETPLLYLDTSTPTFRIEGVEQLDPELFLRTAPSFMAWVIRLLFLSDVMNRYYDFRKVVLDLIANFYKEQRPDLIPDVVAAANAFLAAHAAELVVKPLAPEEIRAYYREDRVIWSFYLSARRLDRFIRAKLLRQEYPYILPGKVKR